MDADADDMDSLFEGMQLITPIPNPTPSTEDDTSSSPLDENLFTDLTLTVDQSNPPSPNSTPILSRQLSSSTRKKKRASGLRIGYGRGSSKLDDDNGRNRIKIESFDEGREKELYPDEENKSGFIENGEKIESFDQGREKESYPDEENKSGFIENGEKIESFDQGREKELDPGEEIEETSSGSIGIEKIANGEKIDEESRVEELNVVEEEEGISCGGGGIEEKVEEIRNRIAEKIRVAKEGVGDVSELRKDAIRRRRKASESLIMASEKFRELEKELEDACEAEDFERADVVSRSLEEAEVEKEGLVASLRKAEVDCHDLDSKMVEVLQRQIEVEDECASLLSSFAMDAADNADLVMKNAEALFSKDMEEWLSSSEAVDIKKITLEIESHIMQDTRSGLDNLVEDSLGDDHRERDILHKRKETLTEELEKLLSLVKEKEAEIAENNSNIEKVEKRIAGAVTGFEEVQLSVTTEYDKLQSSLLQVEMDNESLTKRKEEIDAHLSLEENRGTKIRELSRISMDEANTYLEDVGVRKSLLHLVTRYKEDKERLAKMEENLSLEVQSLKHEISAARSSIQDLSSTKSSLQQETDSIMQRLIFIDKRAPELEADKKVAASTRNFKEAARVAAEAKALSVEREELQTKVEAMALDTRQLEDNISSTVDIIRATEEQMVLKEKELAMARFQRLSLVAGSAEAERSAALELGDTGEADILLIEAESANAEASKLQKIHDIKDDEVANLPNYFISAELLSKLQGKQLEQLAASAKIQGL